MKKLIAIIAVVLVLVSLASCAASQSAQSARNVDGGGAPAAANGGTGAANGAYTPTIPANDSFSGADSLSGSGTTSSAVPMDAPAPAASAPSAPAGAASSAPGSAAASGGGADTKPAAAPTAGTGGTEAQNIADSGRKITFSATFTIDTTQYDKDYAAIERIVNQVGGYVADENSSATSYESGKDTGRTATLSLRVPADKFDSVLSGMSGIGTVVNKTRSSQDLSSQYFDTQSRITLLEMRRDRIMGYLKDATDATQIVEFERELTDTLYELDTYQGDLRQMDQLVDFSTIDISLYELITPETIGADGQPLGDRASNAFALSSAGVGSFLRGAAIFGAGAAPVLILLAVIAAIVLAVIKLVGRLRAKRPWSRKKRTGENAGE